MSTGAPLDVTLVRLSERPELIPLVWEMPDAWPEFMNHDPIAESLFTPLARACRDLAVVALDRDGMIVGHATAMAFRLDQDGRRILPDSGWDAAMVWAHRDLDRGTEPDTACALEASVHVDWQGRGLSSLLIGGLRDAARARGFATLVAPVRPNEKHRELLTPMSEYASRTRDDGLPADAWLRVHVRLGA